MSKFKLYDFIACDDCMYGLEIFRVIELHDDETTITIENLRGETSTINLDDPYHILFDEAIIKQELFYKERIMEYKQLVESWQNFFRT